jgi:hypothetical protein
MTFAEYIAARLAAGELEIDVLDDARAAWDAAVERCAAKVEADGKRRGTSCDHEDAAEYFARLIREDT